MALEYLGMEVIFFIIFQGQRFDKVVERLIPLWVISKWDEFPSLQKL